MKHCGSTSKNAPSLSAIAAVMPCRPWPISLILLRGACDLYIEFVLGRQKRSGVFD
jgi:hypothetical protein